ncbi:class I SAM-dependent methyltransferase [Neptuniibacter sp.]|uniref:class I SAM-dependent methyltransferase n=1 Tax=Neptuniibacter sp. TaxID=1962643 RepID=UPI00260A2D36|nr:class I SAM-dependent methyltransferase [Neptuniibacter sp.]MCP4598413.1 class I SAM-dependent methyltransferase [Neptuniibacter sp.]
MTTAYKSLVAIRPEGEEQGECADTLATELDLSVISSQEHNYELVLEVTSEGLKLQPCGKKAPGATYADFISGAVAHRRQFGGGKGQMIAKAVGIKGAIKPTVLDATAGLGKDAFVLATLGCDVTLLERSPIIHALLRDGLGRALESIDVSDIVQNMHLHHANSIEWMHEQAEAGSSYQVVYLDPMFPHNDKSALVKKEMRAFRPIVGDDLDADQLLDAALQIAENRVVVKRPRKAPFLADRKPSLQFEGKSSRYDVYPLKKLEA